MVRTLAIGSGLLALATFAPLAAAQAEGERWIVQGEDGVMIELDAAAMEGTEPERTHTTPDGIQLRWSHVGPDTGDGSRWYTVGPDGHPMHLQLAPHAPREGHPATTRWSLTPPAADVFAFGTYTDDGPTPQAAPTAPQGGDAALARLLHERARIQHRLATVDERIAHLMSGRAHHGEAHPRPAPRIERGRILKLRKKAQELRRQLGEGAKVFMAPATTEMPAAGLACESCGHTSAVLRAAPEIELRATLDCEQLPATLRALGGKGLQSGTILHLDGSGGGGGGGAWMIATPDGEVEQISSGRASHAARPAVDRRI